MLRVTYVPGAGVLVLRPGGALPPEIVAAARAAGGRRSGRGMLLDPAIAGTVLRDLPAEWEDAAARAAHNRSRVRSSARGVLRAARELAAAGPEAARVTVAAGLFAERLDDHQALNVALMTLPASWGACIFDEQGTGKTVSVIAAFDLLAARGEADRMFVVAPKSMVGEWKAEFQRFSGDTYGVAVVSGTPRQRQAVVDGRSDVLVLNYETVSGMFDELVLAARRSRTVLVVDESYNVKNPEAVRTSAVSGLREWCGHAFALCGTPAPNSAADVVSQVDLVDFGYTFAGVRLSDDPHAARDQVRAAMSRRTVYTRNIKARVLPDLPGRRFSEIPVALSPDQRRLYERAGGELAADLTAVSDEQFRRERSRFLTRWASLLRICSDPTPVDPTYAEIPGKIAALDKLLQELVTERGEKVILWSYYRATLRRLATRYAGLGLVRIDGSVTDDEARRSAVRRFQTEDGIKVFLGNPAAAGAGLTLHAARFAIYESLGAQAAHHMQSLDRLHRRGQTRDVEYLTLLATDTVEEPHYRRLLAKAIAQGDLLGDPPDRHPTRQMLLDDVLTGITGTSP